MLFGRLMLFEEFPLTCSYMVEMLFPVRTFKDFPSQKFSLMTLIRVQCRLNQIIYLMFISDVENLLSDWENALSVAIMH